MTDQTFRSPDDLAQAGKRIQDKATNGVHAAEDAAKRAIDKSKMKLAEAVDASAVRIEQAHAYLQKEARERPVTVTALAIGAGVLVGLILAGGRRR